MVAKHPFLDATEFERNRRERANLSYEDKVVTRILTAVDGPSPEQIKATRNECVQETGAPGFTCAWASEALAFELGLHLVARRGVGLDVWQIRGPPEKSATWKAYEECSPNSATLLVFREPGVSREWVLYQDDDAGVSFISTTAIVFRIEKPPIFFTQTPTLFVLQSFKSYLEALDDSK